MKQYDKYKPSGIEWLGEIPEHWEVLRVKDLFLQINDSSADLKEDTYVPLENIESFTGRLIKRVSNENGEDTTLFKTGDILLNKLRPYLAKVLLAVFDGGVSGEVIVYRTLNKNKNRINSKYYFYRFLSQGFISKINSITDGVKMPRSNPNKIFALNIQSPLFKEQTAIANYLDTKTTAIDRKIELLTAKADKYKALRRSLINETVCRGIPSSEGFTQSETLTKMKDSGIEWIGMMPEHWEVKRLKLLGNIETSSVDKKIIEEEAIVKLVNYTDVYGNNTKEIWNSDDYMIVSANNKQIKSKRLRQGNALFTPSSETIADIGVSAVIMEDLVNTLYSYHILRFVFKRNIDLLFKKYLLNNDIVQYYFSKSATGTTRKILGLNTFWNLPIILPPLNEQILIGKYLNEKTILIDSILVNISTQISKLTQLRKTLINDVVTGKIKVTEDSLQI
ncbi:MAG: restriction endonuclease subunit S [Bacteroidales bacterium]|nr:restriction endonuclease subunit S [Bacteroidales bacterium]